MTQPAKRSFKRRFRVCYPPGTGTLVIRTELDWERDIHPRGLSTDGSAATFEIEAQQPFVHFKPCLIKNGSLHWAIGTNNLLIMAGDDDRVVYPFFFSDARGRFSPLVEVESAILDRHHRLRVYLPPGYEENTMARYPFAYMQDGQNRRTKLVLSARSISTQGLGRKGNEPDPAVNASHRGLHYCWCLLR
jgi:hypothetical protein